MPHVDVYSIIGELNTCVSATSSTPVDYFYVESLGCSSCGSAESPCQGYDDATRTYFYYASQLITCSQYNPLFTYYSNVDCTGTVTAIVGQSNRICEPSGFNDYSYYTSGDAFIPGYRAYFCNETFGHTTTGPTRYPTTSPTLSPTYLPGSPSPKPTLRPSAYPTQAPTASPTIAPLSFVTQYRYIGATSCEGAFNEQYVQQLDVCFPYTSTTYPEASYVKVTGTPCSFMVVPPFH
jgi:hypothetical protein